MRWPGLLSACAALPPLSSLGAELPPAAAAVAGPPATRLDYAPHRGGMNYSPCRFEAIQPDRPSKWGWQDSLEPHVPRLAWRDATISTTHRNLRADERICFAEPSPKQDPPRGLLGSTEKDGLNFQNQSKVAKQHH